VTIDKLTAGVVCEGVVGESWVSRVVLPRIRNGHAQSIRLSLPASRNTFGASRCLATIILVVMVFLGVPLCAQDAILPSADQPGSIEAISENEASAAAPQLVAMSTPQEKWNYFVHETVSPLTFGGGTFNAAISQVTNTAPRYGVDGAAFAERFGASIADIASQNFFGDFVVASALHEDPRYLREGQGYGFWHRVGYALSRSVVIRKDSGADTFNFDNVIGSAASTGLSNLYYPPASRNSRGMVLHFGSDVADNGFVNLAPEFWPDFRDWILRRHHSN
jgi:hypothetical protein